jgi:hypothetical protein
MIFRTNPCQQYYSGFRKGMSRVSGGPLTFVTVNSRDACSGSCSEFLFHTRDFCSLPACAVHFVGCFRCFAHTLSPDSSLAARRFSRLGNTYGTASLAVSFNCARELARTQRRSGFLLHYLDKLVYPDVSSTMLTTAAVIICSLNLAFYGRQAWIARLR